MTSSNCLENETVTQLIRDAIAAIRNNNKQPDWQSVFEYTSKTSANNLDQKYIASVNEVMLNKTFIYDKPSKRSSSYFIAVLTSNNSEEEISALAITEHSDSPNNEKNRTDSAVPYLSVNLTTPQNHIENDTKKKERKTLHPKVLASTDSHLNSSLNLKNHSENNKKKGKFEMLDDHKGRVTCSKIFCVWMKSLRSNRDLNTQKK